jgi:hypothetical protein
MKRMFGLLLVSVLLGGCVVVPVGRYYDDNDGYRRGYYRGEGSYYRYDDGYRRGYYRSEGYYPRYNDAWYGYRGYRYLDHGQ